MAWPASRRPRPRTATVARPSRSTRSGRPARGFHERTSRRLCGRPLNSRFALRAMMVANRCGVLSRRTSLTAGASIERVAPPATNIVLRTSHTPGRSSTTVSGEVSSRSGRVASRVTTSASMPFAKLCSTIAPGGALLVDSLAESRVRARAARFAIGACLTPCAEPVTAASVQPATSRPTSTVGAVSVNPVARLREHRLRRGDRATQRDRRLPLDEPRDPGAG